MVAGQPHSAVSSADAVYRKVMWRLLPVLFISYILAYLDRVNVGFAKLGMKDEPWFSDAVFATGSGIFFIGYMLFEVPANIILHRVGARIWMTRIMISWGIVSSMLALSDGTTSFYLLRFLLGITEAGFFPGILLYLTYWFPANYRARIVAMFMTAVAFAGIFGSPVSGWILSKAGDWSMVKPWQWLFLIEGVPSILMGLLLPWLLTDRPARAHWLTDGDRAVLLSDLARDEAQKPADVRDATGAMSALKSPLVWVCCLIYFCFTIGLYGVSFWMPQIISSTITRDPLQIGWLTAIPWVAAAVAMVIFGRHSDRTGERRMHLSLAAWTGAAAFILAGIFSHLPWVTMLMLSIGTMSVMSVVSTFWAVPSALLSGAAMAAGIAFINSIGNLGGYASPEIFGWLRTHYGIGAGLAAVGVMLGLGGGLTFLAVRQLPRKLN
ncbi:MAG: MFS transporter [Chitinophagaceae bacterium]|jgi:sugar phosphate permease|nr:MFS transporter [Chitinophagaceae bacterium]